MERDWRGIVNSKNFRTAFVQTIVALGLCEYAAGISYCCFKLELFWFQKRKGGA